MPIKNSTTKTIKGMDYDRKGLYPEGKMLSSSQLLAYIESPSDFYIENNLGVRRRTSSAMQNGKVFSALYADRKLPIRKTCVDMGVRPARIIDLFERVIPRIPDIGLKKAEYALKHKVNGWIIRATLDGFPMVDHIIENKTGVMPWTQYRADTAPQVTLQSWLHWLKFKSIPTVYLFWLDTSARPEKEYQTFRTKRSVTQLRNFHKLVVTALENLDNENFSNPIYE
jgi:hypothetical protein